MGFTAKQLAELSRAIAEEVPIGLLLDLSHDGIPINIDAWRKQAISDADGGRLSVARRVVEAYDEEDAVPRLAAALHRRLSRDDMAAGRLANFLVDPEGLDDQKQAALAIRANTLSSTRLRRFMAEAEPRLCVVAAVHRDGTSIGTGFLVGPDLIITAYHTLARHIAKGKQRNRAPGPCYAFFDHLDGAPITAARLGDGSLRRVSFAEDWLKASSKDLEGDGRIAKANGPEDAEASQCLDFALVQLAEPIGLESYAGNGGRRRSWFVLGKADSELRKDRRIIIPQHPWGFPQQVDFGRFNEECSSETRIRYDTETEEGTSGAPCFTELYELVGMHNAAYAPDGNAVLNQAIRIGQIAQLIGNALEAPTEESRSSPLWSVTTAGEPPRPIIGRKALIDWIGRAGAGAGATSEPIFAATGSKPKSGRNFSVEILRAARRDSGDRVVDLGTSGHPMPATLPDLVRTIAEQLHVPIDALADLPARPTADQGDGMGKLNKWASEAVPEWFEGKLRVHREHVTDARIIAQKQVELAALLGRDPSAEDKRLARSLADEPDNVVPLVQTRWDLIWIAAVIKEKLAPEVSDFVAALTRPAIQGTSATGEGGRLRWLFLGELPDFLAGLEPDMVEALDPMQIGGPEVFATAEAISASIGYPYPESARILVTPVINVFLPLLDDPLQRLEKLQTVVAGLKGSIEAETRA